MRFICVLVIALLVSFGGQVLADHPTDLDHLLRQVREANTRDAQIRKEREQRFLAEKMDREKMLAEMREAVARERAHGEELKQQFGENEETLGSLATELQNKTGNLGELFGTVHQVASDLQAFLQESLVSAQFPGRAEWFGVLAKSGKLPNVTELERFWLLLQQEIAESGRVVTFDADVVGTDGISGKRSVTRIGVFDMVSDNTFLRFVPETGQLSELSRQPSMRYRNMAQTLHTQKDGYVPMMVDPTRGTLLEMLMLSPTIPERIQQGGIVGYIIIALGLLGILIVIQRLVYLITIGRRVRRQLAVPDEPASDNPLGRVLSAVRDTHERDVTALELQLDEAILKETPRLTRGQGLVKLLAAVAPLLGLLGTVTGMILTFQSISLFGTGDPRLMAGGISQALVTTVLGLSVAIPLLFFHSLMATRSRALILILDEQSAGIVAQTHSEG